MTRIRFGSMLNLAPYEEVVAHANLVEKSGLDSLWFPDHLEIVEKDLPCFDAWCILAAVAVHTKKVTLGPSVADPFRRHPALLAQVLATLDRISRGRAVLAIGAGEAMNVVPFHIPWDRRVARMQETIQIVRQLMTEHSVNYSGTFYQLSNAMLQVASVQKPSPPIYVAANSPGTRKIAGMLGNGWIAQMMTPAMYEKDLREVGLAAAKVGRSLEDVDVTYHANLAISEDYEEARRLAASASRKMFVSWPNQLVRYGYTIADELDWNRLIVADDSEERTNRLAFEVPDEIAEEISIFGTPDDCISKIERYVRAGVTNFVFMIQGSLVRSYELLERHVLRYFEETAGKSPLGN